MVPGGGFVGMDGGKLSYGDSHSCGLAIGLPARRSAETVPECWKSAHFWSLQHWLRVAKRLILLSELFFSAESALFS